MGKVFSASALFLERRAERAARNGGNMQMDQSVFSGQSAGLQQQPLGDRVVDTSDRHGAMGPAELTAQLAPAEPEMQGVSSDEAPLWVSRTGGRNPHELPPETVATSGSGVRRGLLQQQRQPGLIVPASQQHGGFYRSGEGSKGDNGRS